MVPATSRETLLDVMSVHETQNQLNKLPAAGQQASPYVCYLKTSVYFLWPDGICNVCDQVPSQISKLKYSGKVGYPC
jgi:hypothetical protein